MSNEQLIVEIADIAAPVKPRFDRTGFITQVTRKGVNRTYCVYETGEPDPDLGGGLCGEFGLFTALGYEEAAVGGFFTKLGVGLLERDSEEPYSFRHHYPIDAFDTVAEFDKTKATFTVFPKLCGGYGAKVTKTVSLSGNCVHIDYLLENVGEKAIHTNEYVHNFMGIDGEPLGPDYELHLSFPFEFMKEQSTDSSHLLRIEGREVTWLGRPDRPFYCRFRTPDSACGAGWELHHKPSGAKVSEECSLPLELAALWGTTHVVSPELFVALHVEPGKSLAWSRKYRFE
ncbi:MAG: hypothetical protein K0R57_2921 [Paenibacillaceae bacterium]|nr:hypothetical protein [Paenibacillaceae bacterium]